MDSYNSVAIISGLISLVFIVYYLRQDKLQHIPSPRSTGPISSWFAAYQYVNGGAPTIIEEGYRKYKGRVFRVADLNRWTVVVSTPALIEELRKAPEEALSFHEGIRYSLQLDHTFGRDAIEHEYHIPVIRTQLTRHLTPLFADIYDEIVQSFADGMPATERWTSVPVLKTIMRVVSRTSNRIFVGLPYCRDPAFCELGVRFAVDVIKTGVALHLTPIFLRPLVGKLISPASKRVEEGKAIIGKLLEDRLKLFKEHSDSDWPDKPSDMIQWLIEEANEEERTVDSLVLRILVVNFAAIHTSSTSFTHALHTLAAHPECVAPLREEIEGIVRVEGWTKAAVQRMRKLDSFMKECQRLNGLGALAMSRIAVQDYTFADGTRVPKGTLVMAVSRSMHHDDAVYAPDADAFDPWRFARMREADGDASLKHQMVHTSSDYVSFGHGKHACPGRFFAVNELKLMMAHILLTYDVRPEAVIPSGRWIRHSLLADPVATVDFRKRQT
ncbi:cytochrome P450 [Phanerochaete sordida]|uniref:Cytochrome P450 n=1 Tax=Phanerochaete sordida TaxID=48140 RepID=A0A9P3LDR1_9APHY|nr:cytochrome P450 [Phanerochaete sordida]